MLTEFRSRARAQEGFTLIELLVVILIIGILAAIALPSFLGQQAKGQDAAAKSNARNAVAQMESCYTDAQTYVPCTNTTLSDAGLPTTSTTEKGKVKVTIAGTATGYQVTAYSQSGNNFTVTHNDSGTTTNGCSNTQPKGGCNSSWLAS